MLYLGTGLAGVWAAPSPASGTPTPLRVAFVQAGPVGEAAGVSLVDAGRRAMDAALGAKVASSGAESPADGVPAERALRRLAAQGPGLVFVTHLGDLATTLRVAAGFPQVRFEHAGGDKTAANVGTYRARCYEARYLAGMLAGHTSKNGVAGYVAGLPRPDVVQGINAFTLGMRAANPRAQVRVAWLGPGFDAARERLVAQSLVDQGADMLSHHGASLAVARVAQENFRKKGVHLLASQSDMRRVAPDAQLAATTLHWGGHFTQAAQSVIAGTWTPRAVWGGMKDGLVRFSGIHPQLPADLRALLERRREDIVAGRFRPFAAPLIDNEGRLRHADSALSDATLARMDWFVQGVVGSVPRLGG